MSEEILCFPSYFFNISQKQEASVHNDCQKDRHFLISVEDVHYTWLLIGKSSTVQNMIGKYLLQQAGAHPRMFCTSEELNLWLLGVLSAQLFPPVLVYSSNVLESPQESSKSCLFFPVHPRGRSTCSYIDCTLDFDFIHLQYLSFVLLWLIFFHIFLHTEVFYVVE